MRAHSLVLLVAAWGAAAEGLQSKGVSTDQRVVGASSVRPFGAGLLSVDRIGSRDNVTHGLYGFGVRPSGELWLHWGDHLALVDPAGEVRGVDLKAAAGSVAEWAGADLFLEAGDTLWLGVEVGGSRDFVRVRLAELERMASQWPQRPEGCPTLPGVTELMTRQVHIETCSGGMPNPRAPPRVPPEVVQ